MRCRFFLKCIIGNRDGGGGGKKERELGFYILIERKLGFFEGGGEEFGEVVVIFLICFIIFEIYSLEIEI